MSAIEVKNLSKSWGEVEAVKNISFTVPEKSFTVLLGPSGCGKSTILKMLSGLENVTSGTIKIENRDVTDVEASKRGVSMVFQSLSGCSKGLYSQWFFMKHKVAKSHHVLLKT